MISLLKKPCQITNNQAAPQINERRPCSSSSLIADYALCLGSSETDSFLRPFFRLPDMILRPLAEDILSLNPCLFFLFLLDGWNVRFMTRFYLKAQK